MLHFVGQVGIFHLQQIGHCETAFGVAGVLCNCFVVLFKEVSVDLFGAHELLSFVAEHIIGQILVSLKTLEIVTSIALRDQVRN